VSTAQADCDILIVGAGLAGLGLALQLCDVRFAHLRVIVVEQRASYVRDRTWSYWRTAPHRYSILERAQWSAWRLGHKGQSIVASAHGWQYASIDADAFYTHALAQINACSHVKLRLGLQVQDLRDGPLPCVVISTGEEISTQWLFDARPPSVNQQGLAQHFVGWEISTDRPCFVPDVLDVMDFQTHDDAGLHFLYVLPYSSNRALIESTWISASDVQPNYELELSQYIGKHWPTARYKVEFVERGYLPLETSAKATVAVKQGTRVLRIGRSGGTLRASTGFAFLETLAHVEHIANVVAAAASLQVLSVASLRFKRHWLDSWMDRVLFNAMRSRWQRAPEFFMRMFELAPSEQLMQFLSGGSSLKARFALALSLPTLPFIKAAMRVLTARKL
jgi:lycopene beta-cyclase